MPSFINSAALSLVSLTCLGCSQPEASAPSPPAIPKAAAEAPSEAAPKATPPERPAPLTPKAEPSAKPDTLPVNPSPDGKTHPGHITHVDQTDGDRTWTVDVNKVPQSVAWAEDAHGAWVPVVKVVISGTPSQRHITSYDAAGNALKTLTQAAP